MENGGLDDVAPLVSPPADLLSVGDTAGAIPDDLQAAGATPWATPAGLLTAGTPPGNPPAALLPPVAPFGRLATMDWLLGILLLDWLMVDWLVGVLVDRLMVY